MASRALDEAAIESILNKAGPALLKKLSIEPLILSYLVQDGILTYRESQDIFSAKIPSHQCNELLSRLYQISPSQFVDFCLILHDKLNKKDIVSFDFGLDIKNLRTLKDAEKSDGDTEGERREMKRPSSPKTTVEVDIKMKVRVLGQEVDKEIYKEFVFITSPGSDGPCVRELVDTLMNKNRDAVRFFYASLVFRMSCPSSESLLDLQELCTGGKLADLARNIFLHHPTFKRFNLQELQVAFTMESAPSVKERSSGIAHATIRESEQGMEELSLLERDTTLMSRPEDTVRIETIGHVSGRHIKKMAELIGGRHYHLLGTQLGFTYNELEKLATPPTGGPTQYAARMLNKWYDEHADLSVDEVRQTVVDALLASGRADIAAEVNVKLQTEKDIEKVFQNISVKLVKEWRDVGIHLGVPADTLQACKSYLDLQEDPTQRMLQLWQQRTDPLDQRPQLITALTELKLMNVIKAIGDGFGEQRSVQTQQPVQSMVTGDNASQGHSLLQILKDRTAADQPTTEAHPSTAISEREKISMKYQDYLKTHGFEWFLDHDCASDELKENIADPELPTTREYVRKRLTAEKLKIENSIKELQLTNADSNSKSNTSFRCVLLGKTGDGKSSLGNLLIGGKVFGVGDKANSETHTIQYEQAAGLEIIDTPGFGDSNKEVDAEFEITKIFENFKEGIHCFIYVVNIANPRIAAADVEIFKKIKELFGEKMLHHTIVVLTHSDAKLAKGNSSLKDYVASMKGNEFGEIFDIIGNNVIAVDNDSAGYKRELHREGVIDVIRQSVYHACLRGNGACYTTTYFDEAKNALEAERMKRREKIEAEEIEADKVVEDLINRKLSFAGSYTLLKLFSSREKQLSLMEKVIESTPPQYRDYARKGGITTLWNQLHSMLYKHVIDIVNVNVQNCDLSMDHFVESIQADNTQLVQAVGKEHVIDIIGRRYRELQEKKKNEDWLAAVNKMEEEAALAERHRQRTHARLMRDMEAKIKEYVTANIVLHDRPDDIVNQLLEQNELYDRQQTEDMVQKFLWSYEGRALVERQVRSSKYSLKREAISKMEFHTRIAIRKFLSAKTRSEMEECKRDEASHLEITTQIVQGVMKKLRPQHLDMLSDVEIQRTVVESFNESIINVTNATLIEKIRMAFSFLFSVDMDQYVHVKGSF